jgi:ABC-type bacteriocin/lantibiotic exporter with double-glycine peptidase domain
VALLPAVIGHLCELLRVPFDTPRRLAVLSALEPGPQAYCGDPLHMARLALQAADLSPSSAKIPPSAIAALRSFDSPLLTPVQQGWLVFDPRPAVPTMTVHDVRSATTSLRDASALTMLFGAEADTPRDWLVVELRLPLQVMRIPHDDARPKDAKALSRLRALVLLERETIGAAVVYAMVVGLFMLATPLAVQALVNTIAFGSLVQPLIILTLLVFAGIALANTLRVLEHIVIEYLQRRLFVHAMMDLASRLPRVDAAAHAQRYTPELVNRFFDVMTIQKAASGLLLDGLGLALQTSIGLVILAFYHPLLLAFDVMLLAALAFILFVLGRKGVKTSIYESNAKYAAVAWLEDIARHPIDFKSYSGAQMAVERANILAREWVDARAEHYKIVLRQIIGVVALQAVASALLLGLGGWLVMKGQLTLGQLVASELIVTLIVSSVAKFGKHFESFYDLVAGVGKLGDLIDLPLEDVLGESLRADDKPLSARLEEVCVEGRSGQLRDVSITLEPGAVLGLTGLAGSGKSTILDLIYGLRHPDQGRVFVGGLDMRHAALPMLRDEMVLLREPALIDGTIEENMQLGAPTMSREAMNASLALLGLKTLCDGFEEGLNTQLTAAGAPLSAGQIVRLVLARAIAQRPRMLLIDGLLDQLSPEERVVVLGKLLEGRDRWTLVIVSQSQDILKRCERVVRIKDGELVEVKG